MLFVSGILAFSSCTIMHIPNAENVPLLENKSEVKLNLGISDFQGAYAISKNIGVIANGYFKNSEVNISNDLMNNGQRYFFEGAVGFFKPLENDLVFEVYGGAGLGKVNYEDRFDGGSIFGENYYKFSSNFNRYFIQPNLGIKSKGQKFELPP